MSASLTHETVSLGETALLKKPRTHSDTMRDTTQPQDCRWHTKVSTVCHVMFNISASVDPITAVLASPVMMTKPLKKIENFVSPAPWNLDQSPGAVFISWELSPRSPDGKPQSELLCPSHPTFHSLIPEGPELREVFVGEARHCLDCGTCDMECSTSFSERAKGHMSELPWLGPPLSSDPSEETCREATPAFHCSEWDRPKFILTKFALLSRPVSPTLHPASAGFNPKAAQGTS